MRWVGHVACMGEKRKACRVLVGKPEEKDHSEDRSRWHNRIRMDLREIG
jgi:hypothetical protein